MRRFLLSAIVILAVLASLVPVATAAEPANSETVTVNLDGQLPFFDSPSPGTLTIMRTGTSSATSDTWELSLTLNNGPCTGAGTASEAWTLDSVGRGVAGSVTLLTYSSWSCPIFQPELPLTLAFSNAGSVVSLLGVPFAVNPALQAPFTGQASIGVTRTPEGMPADYDILHGHFFSQTATAGRGYGVRDGGQHGGTDSLGQPIPFWSLFKALGGVDGLGYPVTQVFIMDGLYYQGFQRGLLQWLPDAKIARPANVLDFLHDKGLDGTLESRYLVPQQVNDEVVDAKKDRLGALYGGTGDGWLTDPEIKAKFIAAPTPHAVSTWNTAYEDRGTGGYDPTKWTIEDALNLYGLPTSLPVDRGDFTVQRFERGALQKWTADVPGMPAKGSIVGVLSGDYAKLLGTLPESASVSELQETM